MSDPAYLFIIVFLLKAVVFITPKFIKDIFIQRKAIHVVVGLVSCLTLYLFKNWNYIIAIALLFFLLNIREILLKRNEAMGKMSEGNWGTVYFPLSFAILLLLAGERNPEAVLLSMMIVTFSDSLAGLVGRFLGNPKNAIPETSKTYNGSLAFFFSSVMIIFPGLAFFYSIPADLALWGAILLSALLTIIEAVCSGGLDNLILPLTMYFLIYHFTKAPFQHGMMMSAGYLLSAVIAYTALKYRFLTFSGTLAAIILGVCVFFWGDWRWFLPLLTFFLSGSLLSKIGSAKKKDSLSLEDISPRNGKQVFSNCGLILVLLVAHSYFKSEIYLLAYLSLIAAMTADTWASEIGILSGSKPFWITNFKPTVHGSSGAITFLGLFAALGGAVLISLFIFLWPSRFSIMTISLIVTSAWLAQLADSYLGVFLQAKYICGKCGLYIEKPFHCGLTAKKISGFTLIDNSIVNFISSGLASLFTILILNFFPIQ